jgi:hypothetical protein
MVSPEHEVVASVVARVCAVCILGVSPLEVPVPDSFSNSLLVVRNGSVSRIGRTLGL